MFCCRECKRHHTGLCSNNINKAADNATPITTAVLLTPKSYCKLPGTHLACSKLLLHLSLLVMSKLKPTFYLTRGHSIKFIYFSWDGQWTTTWSHISDWHSSGVFWPHYSHLRNWPMYLLTFLTRNPLVLLICSMAGKFILFLIP